MLVGILVISLFAISMTLRSFRIRLALDQDVNLKRLKDKMVSDEDRHVYTSVTYEASNRR